MKDYEICSRHIVMYPDCNSGTRLFGGMLLCWLDADCAIFSGRFMRVNKLVTAKFNGMEFKVPVELGRVVTIYAKVIEEGTSSLTVHALVTKTNDDGSSEVEVAETTIVYVSVDDNGRPKTWNTGSQE